MSESLREHREDFCVNKLGPLMLLTWHYHKHYGVMTKGLMSVQTFGPGRPSPGGPLLPGGPLGPITPCKDEQLP